MNNTILTIKKELRSSIRDRKSLLMMFMTPLFIPVFVFFFSYMFDTMMDRAQTDTFAVGVNYELSEVEEHIVEALRLDFIYFEEDKMYDAFQREEIVAYVILRDNVHQINFNPQDNDSAVAQSLIISYLEQYNNYHAANYLLQNDIDPENVFNIITYTTNEIKGKSMFIDQIITMAFVFAIMSIALSATYAATDSTAGEKERGTLETLLTFPINSRDLIAGKYIAAVIACIATAIICGILLSVSLLIASNMFNIFESVSLDFGWSTIVLSFVILIAFSLFISAVSIAIASLSKSYKEAQSALTPVSLAPMVPMFMSMMEIKMTTFLSMIPVINHVMILNDLFVGSVDYLNLIIMLISTVVFTILLIIYIGHQYKSEKVLFST